MPHPVRRSDLFTASKSLAHRDCVPASHNISARHRRKGARVFARLGDTCHRIAPLRKTMIGCEVPAPESVFEVRAADGYTLIVRRHGNPNGLRLILSHGNGLAIDAYYPFWSLLVDRFDCFVHDVRNHGWNPVDHDLLRHNVPFFVNDGIRIVRDIERRFGPKPTIGVFHSLSTILALHQASTSECFDALVLFDPPLCPPGGLPIHLQGVGTHMGARTRKLPSGFKSVEAFAVSLAENPAFGRMSREALELLARCTLRCAADADGYELRCPREYEAQILEHLFSWAITVDLDEIRCPIKAIGADPTLDYSFIPSMDLGVLVNVDYDFVPETSHFLQLEEPDVCAALVVEFLESGRLA